MMKYTKYMIAAAAVITVLNQSSWAEMRTWTDDAGHTVKAEFVENVDGMVTLQAADNKTIHVSISNLSVADQELVLSYTPPRIDVDVQKITDTHTKSFGGDDDHESVQIKYGPTTFKATLTSHSMIPYAGKITAELYIMGSRAMQSQYTVLDRTISPVSFKGMNDTFKFSTGNVDLTQIQDGDTMGTQYEGYLMVLVDAEGHVFEVKASNSKFKENAAAIRKMAPGDNIDQKNLLPLAQVAMDSDDDSDGADRDRQRR